MTKYFYWGKLTRKEFIENSADAPRLARSLKNLQNLQVIASIKGFLWQNNPFLSIFAKVFLFKY